MAWNQTTSTPKKAPTRQGLPSSVKGLLTLIVVCALGGLVWWFVSVSSGEDGKMSRRRMIEDANPVKVGVERKVESEAARMGGVVTDAVKEKTPEEIEAEERAKDPLYDRHHIVAKKPLLGDPVEQLMLSVFETEVGEMPPMLPAIPTISEQQFRKIVDKMAVTDKDDNEETRNAKLLINQVKSELKKYLADGGTIEGFLSYYVNILDSAYRERMTTREMIVKTMKTEDPDVAREFFLKANERLLEKGIKTVTLTTRQKTYLGLRDE